MAFSHGSAAAVYANGYDISAYLNEFRMRGTAKTHETTTFGKSYVVRAGGLRDGSGQGRGLFDGDTGAVDAVLHGILGDDDAVLVYLPQGDGFGNDGLAMEGIEASYEVSSPVDGMVDVSMGMDAAVGVEPVETLHELGAEAASGNGTSLDNLAASTGGGAVYVVCASGSAVTFGLEDSADGSSWAAVSGVTIPVQTGPSAVRVEISGTIREYARITWDAGCTFWAGLYRG